MIHEILKHDCMTCDFWEKFKSKIKCDDCPFTKSSQGAVTGKKFKKYGIKVGIPKQYLYYFLNHPELNWKLPNIPDEDYLGNSRLNYNRWNWEIHHEDGNHWNDSEWNQLLVLFTEHSHLHWDENNPMKDPLIAKKCGERSGRTQKKQVENGTHHGIVYSPGYYKNPKINKVKEWLKKLNPGEYSIDLQLVRKFDYHQTWGLRKSIENIITREKLINLFSFKSIGRNRKKWFLIRKENIVDKEFAKKLEQLGVERMKYYYYSTPVVDNVFTACLFITKDNKLLSRGIAICSLLDQNNKEIGRRLAHKRATKALFRKENSDWISDDGREWDEVSRKRKIKGEDDIPIAEEIERVANNYKLVETGKSAIVFFDLSCSYPMMETKDEGIFYKSMYKPIPTELEEKLIR